jgi:hypothetical protein
VVVWWLRGVAVVAWWWRCDGCVWWVVGLEAVAHSGLGLRVGVWTSGCESMQFAPFDDRLADKHVSPILLLCNPATLGARTAFVRPHQHPPVHTQHQHIINVCAHCYFRSNPHLSYIYIYSQSRLCAVSCKRTSEHPADENGVPVSCGVPPTSCWMIPMLRCCTPNIELCNTF